MTAKKPPPRDLQAAGRALWREVMAGFELRADEMVTLTAACRCADELGRLEEALADGPVTVEGSKGQPVANPLFEEVRRHRATSARLLQQLGLAEADQFSNTSLARAAAGRALAHQRWARRGA